MVSHAMRGACGIDCYPNVLTTFIIVHACHISRPWPLTAAATATATVPENQSGQVVSSNCPAVCGDTGPAQSDPSPYLSHCRPLGREPKAEAGESVRVVMQPCPYRSIDQLNICTTFFLFFFSYFFLVLIIKH